MAKAYRQSGRIACLLVYIFKCQVGLTAKISTDRITVVPLGLSSHFLTVIDISESVLLLTDTLGDTSLAKSTVLSSCSVPLAIRYLQLS